ncbi:MAG: hypothetical protein M1822_005793 [Bathelium mastoideum]|nr:MAG: hypothetical protein M1822_005793 [Bathelium mastoideum]
MDPLSFAASVIAVVDLSHEVVKYLIDFKDAPKECKQCAIEALNMENLLVSLQSRLKGGQLDEPWFNEVQKLNDPDGPLSQYQKALEQLRSKTELQDPLQRAQRRLLWRFMKEEVASIIANMERLKSIISILLENDHFKLSQATQKDTSSIRDTLPALETQVVDQQHNAVMQWLSSIDFSTQRQDIISRREKGTAKWFLDSAEFAGWLQGPDKTLFCPGIPGAGKTMMAAVAIDHLYRTASSNDIGIIYLFCSYKAHVLQNASNLLAAMLKQLVIGRSDLADPVVHMYKRGSRPALDELMQALKLICSGYSTTYMVVDALDECPNTDGVRSYLIDKMRELQASSNVRLLATSRPIPEVVKYFPSDPQLEVRASEEDIMCFVASQIQRLPSCIQRSEELKNAVKTRIVEAVDGMFLLARLHIDSLLDQTTPKKVRVTLGKLRKGSEALDHAYKGALDRIDGQLPGYRELARRALSWITYAQRLLTTEELRHALAIEPDRSTLDDENLNDVEEIVSVCAGLVAIDKNSSVIRLTHYTTQEYFERIRLEWNPGAQEEIAAACLKYLSFDAFQNGSCTKDKTFEQRITENPFFDYSAHYWNRHIQPLQFSCRASKLALDFLCNDALVDSVIQAISVSTYRCSDYSLYFPGQSNGLHLAARYGLNHIIEMLLEQNYRSGNMNIDSKDSYGLTPLSWAATGGHKAVILLLLATGKTEIETRDNNGWTPLFLAANNGHAAVVELLLATGKVDLGAKDVQDGGTLLSQAAWAGHETVVRLLFATGKFDIDAKNRKGRTPLWLAANNGYEAVVRLLLIIGKVNVDVKDSDGQTALWGATKGGHEAVVQLLLATDKVDVNAKDTRYGRTPLWCAAEEGHEAIVELLLATGKVNVNMKDSSYRQTPLWPAAERGHDAVVRLLVATNDVDVDMKDSLHGRTPLWGAAKEGHESVVKLLLATGKVDVNMKDSDGRTALWGAAKEGHEAVVQLLLTTGKVNVNIKANDGQTALWGAAKGGHSAVVQLLLATGKVNIDVRDRYGRTPLRKAAHGGHKAVVQQLLDTGKVNIDAEDSHGQTPLMGAAEQGHKAVVLLLLATGKVDVNARDSDGRTPLWEAVEQGHEAIVRLLLATGKVDVNARDSDGRTPLWGAAGHGHEAIVRLLLATGKVDVNARDSNGRTPLWGAAEEGHEAVVQLLQAAVCGLATLLTTPPAPPFSLASLS